MSVILALDCGTSSAKALVCDAVSGAVLGRATVPVDLAVGPDGQVEQDPMALLDAVVRAGRMALTSGDHRVAGVALTNQRESVVAWDRRTGEPLGPVLSWQDSRTAQDIAEWDDASRARVKALTGLTLDAMYSAPKMRWLLDRVPASSDAVVGTVDAWLVARLTGDVVAERGNASRTMLLSLATGEWDDELLEAFGVPRALLPEIRSSDAGFGALTSESGLPAGVPVLCVLADSHASLLAHTLGSDTGVVKATLGTGTSVMTALPALAPPGKGIDTTVAWWRDAPTYALEGNILATGQAVDWAAGLIDRDSARPGGAVVADAAATVASSEGVTLVPAFTGLGSPHWDRQAVALLSGMTAGTTAGHVARAALESVAHQIADVIDAMASSGAPAPVELRVDGGGSTSDLLLQIQADVIGLPVRRVREPELSAVGAALLASQCLGHIPDSVTTDDAVTPQWSPSRRSAERAAWKREVDRARMRIEES